MSVRQRETSRDRRTSPASRLSAFRPVLDPRPLVSVILPAYNEEALLRENVVEICDYLTEHGADYRWELLIINDGSRDSTGAIADELALEFAPVRALHHPDNFGLGQVLKFGFVNSRGDYIVTLDVDLSYDVRHILELIARIRETRAKIVLASPYMHGGSIRNVPFARRQLSIYGNRFLRLLSQGRHSTLTSLVRVYDGPFIRSLDLRAMGMDIMPEMLYKAMVLRARIEESPARLDWGPLRRVGERRRSSLRVLRQIRSTLLSGFVFRPVPFFLLPGLLAGAVACVVNLWLMASLLELWTTASALGPIEALVELHATRPLLFLASVASTLLSVQLLGLGVIALQNKRYFEDLYHLGSRDRQRLRRPSTRTDDN